MSDLDIDQLAAQLHRLQRGGRVRLPYKAHTMRFLDETLELIFPNIIGAAEPCSSRDVRCRIDEFGIAALGSASSRRAAEQIAAGDALAELQGLSDGPH